MKWRFWKVRCLDCGFLYPPEMISIHGFPWLDSDDRKGLKDSSKLPNQQSKLLSCWWQQHGGGLFRPLSNVSDLRRCPLYCPYQEGFTAEQHKQIREDRSRFRHAAVISSAGAILGGGLTILGYFVAHWLS